MSASGTPIGGAPAAACAAHASSRDGRLAGRDARCWCSSALVLAIATRQRPRRARSTSTSVSIADLQHLAHYTGHDYNNISVDQETLGDDSKREVVCGNTSPGAPKAKDPDLPDDLAAPTVDGQRTVHGGWYLPAYVRRHVQPTATAASAPAGEGAVRDEHRRWRARRAAAPGSRGPRAPPHDRARLVAAGGADAARRPRCASRRSTCRASGTTRRSRPCTCCTRACGRRCARSPTARTRRRCGTCSRGPTRACSAPARSRCGCPRRSRASRLCPSPGRSAASSPSRRAAIACAALVAVNPLFVWYSQEARAYGLFVFIGALAMLCFLRAAREPTRAAHGGVRAERRAGAADPLLRRVPADPDGAVAAVRSRERAVRRCPRVGVLVLVGLALLPLISAQGGHGTQWIGRWPLSDACRRSRSTTSPATPARRSGTASSCSSRCRSSPAWCSACGAWREPAAESRPATRRRRCDRRSRSPPAAVLIPIVLGRLRRRLPRAAQPRRRDDPASRALIAVAASTLAAPARRGRRRVPAIASLAAR